jgi:hypothetical protein
MKIERNSREGTSVICPVEYKGLTGCGEALRYFCTNDAGLIECPNCGLWFAPTDVPARPHSPPDSRIQASRMVRT